MLHLSDGYGFRGMRSGEAPYIEKLLSSRPNARRNGYKKAIRKLLGDEFDDKQMIIEELAGILPDAYEIIGRNIVLYEIEYSNKLIKYKLERYSNFADATTTVWTHLFVYNIQANTTAWIKSPQLDRAWIYFIDKNMEDHERIHGEILSDICTIFDTGFNIKIIEQLSI